MIEETEVRVHRPAHNQGMEGAWHLAEQDEYIFLLTMKKGLAGNLEFQKSRLAFADNDLDRPDVSSAGFTHADAADLFGDVVLRANNLERTAAADGADKSAVTSRAFVVAIECVG